MLGLLCNFGSNIVFVKTPVLGAYALCLICTLWSIGHTQSFCQIVTIFTWLTLYQLTLSQDIEVVAIVFVAFDLAVFDQRLQYFSQIAQLFGWRYIEPLHHRCA